MFELQKELQEERQEERQIVHFEIVIYDYLKACPDQQDTVAHMIKTLKLYRHSDVWVKSYQNLIDESAIYLTGLGTKLSPRILSTKMPRSVNISKLTDDILRLDVPLIESVLISGLQTAATYFIENYVRLDL